MDKAKTITTRGEMEIRIIRPYPILSCGSAKLDRVAVKFRTCVGNTVAQKIMYAARPIETNASVSTSMDWNLTIIENIFKWKQMETFSALLAICAGNSPVPLNSPHKGKSHGALMFSLISAWINGWVNNRDAGDLRRNCAHYDVIVCWIERARHICVPILIGLPVALVWLSGRNHALIDTNHIDE